MSVANFVQPDNATEIPRAQGELASQKPKMRKTGTIVVRVHMETYSERKRSPRECERGTEPAAAVA
jgi:hypothetical protein